MSEAAPSDLAKHLDEVRIAVGETEALAAVAMEFFDNADWHGADTVIVERLAYMLGVIVRSATTAVGAFHRLHGTVADALPATAGERWDGEGEPGGG
jgi:hypothetical protein